MGNQKPKKWEIPYTVLLIALLILTIPSAIILEHYTFNPFSVEALLTLLAPLFVISLFLERALEVFVSTWRVMDRVPIDDRIKWIEEQYPSIKKAVSSANEPKIPQEIKDEYEQNRIKRDEFKAKTKRLLFLIGLSGGIVISMAGVRILRPLTSMDADPIGIQSSLFNFVDIILTGGLIGGGSDGIHKLMNVITSALDTTRDRIEKAKPKPEGAQ